MPPLFDDIERRTFDYFWETTPADTGLAPDRYPAQPFASVAAIGYALTAYPVGAERGWITRAQAAERLAVAEKVAALIKYKKGLMQRVFPAPQEVRE